MPKFQLLHSLHHRASLARIPPPPSLPLYFVYSSDSFSTRAAAHLSFSNQQWRTSRECAEWQWLDWGKVARLGWSTGKMKGDVGRDEDEVLQGGWVWRRGRQIRFDGWLGDIFGLFWVVDDVWRGFGFFGGEPACLRLGILFRLLVLMWLLLHAGIRLECDGLLVLSVEGDMFDCLRARLLMLNSYLSLSLLAELVAADLGVEMLGCKFLFNVTWALLVGPVVILNGQC
ncbi:hypothetical protein Droror1_Dr00007224 [Drosera rotundifolia]